MTERTRPDPVLPTSDADGPEEEKDWEWRRRIRANPHSRRVYRGVVFAAGLVLVLGGLVLVPLPGPGWLIVIVGIAVWASEFEPAARLLDFVKTHVRAWEKWAKAQAWWVKGLLALACALVVAGAIWLVLWFTGVPAFVPGTVAGWLHTTVGL